MKKLLNMKNGKGDKILKRIFYIWKLVNAEEEEHVDDDNDVMAMIGDIYIMMSVCLSVCNENDHFLLGVSCNYLNPP